MHISVFNDPFAVAGSPFAIPKPRFSATDSRFTNSRKTESLEPSENHDLPTVSDDLSDESLVSAIVEGDPDSFRLLIERFRSKILRTASRFARNREELEDLSQDIFLKAWKGLPSFKNTAPFEHWLMRLAVRVCYDFLRKNRNRREKEVSKEAIDESGDRLTADAGENTDLRAEEAREVLNLALDALKPKERLILTLKELQNKSVKEVAGLTGWSESNVKVRAMRARNRLREILIEQGYED